ncbi:MAG TPA: Mur ligase family protein, partial [Candidatus Saccharimonadales bacterium]|nr:Mur ligase family protein [Candidatus Saccharimonadales bacterium]
MWERFSLKKIALLGAGTENVSLIPFFEKAGATVTIFERQPSDRIPKGAETVSGDDYLAKLEGYDYAFRSPGFPLKVVQQAVEKLNQKPEITSAMNLLLEILPGVTIGVTGTKGKGTTATMIGTILKTAGKKNLVAGNIGESTFSHLDEIDKNFITILELSSFQLEDLTRSPHIAVLLAITSDHLQPLSESSPNYHQSFEDYVEAKGQITHFQTADDFLVYVYDNDAAHSLAEKSQAQAFGISNSSGQASYLITDQGWLMKDSK